MKKLPSWIETYLAAGEASDRNDHFKTSILLIINLQLQGKRHKKTSLERRETRSFRFHQMVENKNKPLFIGITGGTASGKTSLCNRIAEAFG